MILCKITQGNGWMPNKYKNDTFMIERFQWVWCIFKGIICSHYPMNMLDDLLNIEYDVSLPLSVFFFNPQFMVGCCLDKQFPFMPVRIKVFS